MTKQYTFLFSLFLFFCIGCQKNPLDSTDGIHIRRGFSDFNGHTREYKFKDLFSDIGFVSTFPMDVVEKLADSIKKKVSIDYWLYSSIEDVELAMVERLDLSNLYMRNMIDFPRQGGEIGDNCWYQFQAGTIQFIRNNVLVSITPGWDASVDSSEIELVARKIDRAIINAPKVADANLVPAPVVNSVDIISALPTDWAQPVTVRVNATDPESQQLWFRKYASGFSIVSDNGVLTLILHKYVDSSGDPQRARVRIWVWNENHLVSSIESEIPFGK